MIIIVARRWFDKSYGNTYHSVIVCNDKEVIGKNDFAYGYDDMYLSTAHKILKDAKITDLDFLQWRNESNFIHFVSDVCRKKDLEF